jgi:hypothetical protein
MNVVIVFSRETFHGIIDPNMIVNFGGGKITVN